MVAVPDTPRFRDDTKRYVGVGIINGIGVGALVVHLVQGFEELQQQVLTVLFGEFVPVLLSLLLLSVSYWMIASELDGSFVLRTAGWCVLGTVVMASAGELMILYQHAYGVRLSNRIFVVTNVAMWGAAIGTLLGIYDFQLASRTAEVREQKERFEFLNQLLRHEVLNTMNLALFRLDRLGRRVSPEDRGDVESLKDQGQHIVTLIQRVRALTNPDERDGDPGESVVDVGGILAEELERTRSTYSTAECTDPEEIPRGVYVHGDDLLSEVFKNLIGNAIRHNDKEPPRVEVAIEPGDETVRVTVADNGPGIPDRERERVFERNVKGEESRGSGLGLYLVDTFVDSYGGEISIGDNDPEGTVFAVELPKASAPPDRDRDGEIPRQRA